MAFPEEVVKQAWERSGGQCECQRRTHKHFYIPCGKSLAWKKRGQVGTEGWEAHHVTSFGGDTLSNCEILCWECNEATF
jgi:hypothetical protein